MKLSSGTITVVAISSMLLVFERIDGMKLMRRQDDSSSADLAIASKAAADMINKANDSGVPIENLPAPGIPSVSNIPISSASSGAPSAPRSHDVSRDQANHNIPSAKFSQNKHSVPIAPAVPGAFSNKENKPAPGNVGNAGLQPPLGEAGQPLIKFDTKVNGASKKNK